MYDFEYSERSWSRFLVEIKEENLTNTTEKEVVGLCFGHSLSSEVAILEQRMVLKKRGSNISEITKNDIKKNCLNLVLWLTRFQQFLLFTNRLRPKLEIKLHEIIKKVLKYDLSQKIDLDIIWDETDRLDKELFQV